MSVIEIDTNGLQSVSFGDEIRQKEFCLRPDSSFVNNGSYGTVPRRVMDVQKKYLDQMESHPDHWFRRTVYKYWVEARQVIADFVGSDVDDLFFVTNATQGVNTVVHCLKLQPGDAVLATSLTYGSLKCLFSDIEERLFPGVKALFLEIKMPILSEHDLVKQYDNYLTEHPNIKFVLIDHITSPSAILFPVQELVAVCHKHHALVMVDGAHAPGQVPLNLNTLGADFYTGNLHKWLYTPRGCGILWIHSIHHRWIYPLQTSWNKGKPLDEQFFSQGTKDHIPFICAKQALEFYRAVGGMDKIVGYTSRLTTEARDLLVKELKLEPLAIPASMESPNLRTLKLPGVPAGYDIKEVAEQLHTEIYEKEDIQTIFDWVDGAFCLRISLQIHNTLEDIHRLICVLKPIINNIA